MSEVQETGTSRKIEHIEKSQSSSSKTRKLYVLGVAFVAVLLLGTSFGMMLSATTPSIPTVIEPGSMVSTADYSIFKNGGNYYAKNGTTGQVAYSSSDATDLFDSVLARMQYGGTIFVYAGIYTFGPSDPLIIDEAGIIINGVSTNIPDGTSPPYSYPYGTRLSGNVFVKARDVQLNNLAITGKLNWTSTDDLARSAQFCSARSIYVYGGMEIVGLPGGDASHVPYNVAITESFIWGVGPTNAINITSSAGAPSHVYFTDSVIYQSGGGDLAHLRGYVDDLRFTNCLLDTNIATAWLNLTGGGDQWEISLTNCVFEIQGTTTQVFISIGVGASSNLIGVSVTNCRFSQLVPFRYLVRDDTTAWPKLKNVLFDHVTWDAATLRVRGGDMLPFTKLRFVNCILYWSTLTIQQVYGSYLGEFVGCTNVNPYGLMATPFSGVNDDWKFISIASSYSGSANPPASKNITLMDTAILLTATGGSGLSIDIRDRAGNLVVSGATSLSGYYVPIGFKINFGAFSGGPTITVIGV